MQTGRTEEKSSKRKKKKSEKKPAKAYRFIKLKLMQWNTKQRNGYKIKVREKNECSGSKGSKIEITVA